MGVGIIFNTRVIKGIMREGKSGNCHGLSPHNDVDDSSNVILSETKDLGDSMTVITR